MRRALWAVRTVAEIAALGLTALALTACGSHGATEQGVSALDAGARGATEHGATEQGVTEQGNTSPGSATVDVFAAASLTDVFTRIADDYMSEHPGIEIRLTFAGSSDLAAQINEGAPADVFASANEKQMAVAKQHVDGQAELFASNTLTIAVPAGNPGGVTDFASLAHPDLAVVVCAPEVPCGAAAVAVEESLGVTLSPVSELTNVTDVLGSVASGEADAGLVYATDLSRAKGVEGIAFAGSDAGITRYPIAVMKTGDATDAARTFVDYVLGPQGLYALAAAGFAAPDASEGK